MFKLSITGPDNLVKQESLKLLTDKYSNLEFALLYFPEKENQNRNPGVEWRNKFFSIIPKKNTAIHLCGKEVFDTILSEEFEKSQLFTELKKANRIQININARKDIFTHKEVQSIYSILLSYHFTLILQYHERSKDWILPYIKNNSVENIHVLLDSSLGKGIAPKEFTFPEDLKNINCPIGFAGGFNPENIKNFHEQIKQFKLSKYWLDLETGSRTNDIFDIKKAENLCLSSF